MERTNGTLASTSFCRSLAVVRICRTLSRRRTFTQELARLPQSDYDGRMDVASKDGTSIAVRVSGRGVPLVLVHGTTADASRWTPLLPPLEARFAVHAMD